MRERELRFGAHPSPPPGPNAPQFSWNWNQTLREWVSRARTVSRRLRGKVVGSGAVGGAHDAVETHLPTSSSGRLGTDR
eukprot:4929623-Prymnesium_polylepis.1